MRLMNAPVTSLMLGLSIQWKFSLQEMRNLVYGFCCLHDCRFWSSPSAASLFLWISSSNTGDLGEADYVFTRLSILDFIYLKICVHRNEGAIYLTAKSICIWELGKASGPFTDLIPRKPSSATTSLKCHLCIRQKRNAHINQNNWEWIKNEYEAKDRVKVDVCRLGSVVVVDSSRAGYGAC